MVPPAKKNGESAIRQPQKPLRAAVFGEAKDRQGLQFPEGRDFF